MSKHPQSTMRPGDVILVDGRKATLISLDADPAVGICEATVGIWTEGESVTETVGLHRVRTLDQTGRR